MLQKKSFTLKHGKNSCEEYRAKRLQWIKKGIFILGICVFVALFILPNVDFKGKFKKKDQPTKTTALEMGNVLISFENVTVLPLEGEKVNEDTKQNKQIADLGVASSTAQSHYHAACVFKENKENPCIVNCSNADISDLNKFLHSQQNLCYKNMKLTLINITFSKENGLENNLELQRLNIIARELNSLNDDSLGASTYENLEILELQYCTFLEVDDNIFQSFKYLKHLTIWHAEVPENYLKKLTFLQPLFSTLEEITLNFQQPTSLVCHPENWFLPSNNYKNLKRVTLSGNNFYDSLSNKSFSMLVAIEELILSNCNITFLLKDTFSGIQKTLKFLDLSYNQLTTVTGLENYVFMKNVPLAVNFMENPWHCNCNDAAFLSVLSSDKIIMKEEAKCATSSVENVTTIRLLGEKCVTNVKEGAKSSENKRSADISEQSENSDPASEEAEDTTISIACTKPNSVNNWKEIEMYKAYNKFIVTQTEPLKAQVILFGALNYPLVLFVKSTLINGESYCNMTQGITSYVINANANSTLTQIEVSSLKHKSNYLFFLAKKNENTITPVNCQSFHEGKIVEPNIWLRNKDKYWLYIVALILLIFCLLLPFAITFFIIRYRKKLNLENYERVHRCSDQSYSTIENNKTLEEYLTSSYERYNKIRLSIESSAPNELAPRLPYKYGIRSLTEDNIYATAQNYFDNSLYEDYYEQLE